MKKYQLMLSEVLVGGFPVKNCVEIRTSKLIKNSNYSKLILYSWHEIAIKIRPDYESGVDNFSAEMRRFQSILKKWV